MNECVCKRGVRRWADAGPSAMPPQPSGEPAGSTPPSDDPRILMRPPVAPFLKRGRMKYLCGGGARPYFRVCPDLAGTRSGAGVTRDLDIPGSLDSSFGKRGPQRPPEPANHSPKRQVLAGTRCHRGPVCANPTHFHRTLGCLPPPLTGRPRL